MSTQSNRLDYLERLLIVQKKLISTLQTLQTHTENIQLLVRAMHEVNEIVKDSDEESAIKIKNIIDDALASLNT